MKFKTYLLRFIIRFLCVAAVLIGAAYSVHVDPFDFIGIASWVGMALLCAITGAFLDWMVIDKKDYEQ